MEERLRSHYESLSRVIGFTRTADTKAAPVLALQVALTGALATRIDRLFPVVTGGQWNPETITLVLVLAGYLTSAAGAIWLAAAVYLPRNPRTGASFIFFEDIAAMDYPSFEAAAKEMTGDLIELQLLDQIYRVSNIASMKMKRVRQAIWLSLPTAVFGFTLMAWGSF